MINKIIAASALALLSPTSVQAAAFIVNFSGPLAVASGNDFAGQIKTGLGIAPASPLSYVAGNADLLLSGAATVEFWYLGSESGYANYFGASANGDSYVYRGEGASAPAYPNGVAGLDGPYFAGSAKYIGAVTYASGGSFKSGGVLQNLLGFRSTSSGGITATPGSDGFGIFLAGNAVSGAGYNQLYFGFDDQAANPDRDYDDYVVLAKIITPVPEPASWAMMIAGFGAIGAAMRRRGVRRLQAV
jgi:hypothetical protein